MPVFAPAAARPRQELSMAIVEGAGQVAGLIGNLILPRFPINRRTAHIIKLKLADSQGARILSDKFLRAPGTKFERIVATIGDDTMTVTLRGVEIVIPNELELDYAGYLNVEKFFAARFGEETYGLTDEYMIANAIFNTSNFGSATNSTVAYTVANAATNSFIADIIASTRRLKAKGEPGPYDVTLSGPVMERVRQAATVQGYVAGTLQAGQEATHSMIEQALREFIGATGRVLVGDSYYNTALDGATPSLTQIWSNSYIFVGRSGKTNVQSGMDGVDVPLLSGIGADVYWEGYANGGTPSTDLSAMPFAGGTYVETYPDLTIDSMIARLKMSNQPYIGNPRAGDLINPQYS